MWSSYSLSDALWQLIPFPPLSSEGASSSLTPTTLLPLFLHSVFLLLSSNLDDLSTLFLFIFWTRVSLPLLPTPSPYPPPWLLRSSLFSPSSPSSLRSSLSRTWRISRTPFSLAYKLRALLRALQSWLLWHQIRTRPLFCKRSTRRTMKPLGASSSLSLISLFPSETMLSFSTNDMLIVFFPFFSQDLLRPNERRLGGSEHHWTRHRVSPRPPLRRLFDQS